MQSTRTSNEAGGTNGRAAPHARLLSRFCRGWLGSRAARAIGCGFSAVLLAAEPTGALAQDCADGDGQIEWEVKGRFALFEGNEARARSDALLEEIEAANFNLVDGSPAEPSDGKAAKTTKTAYDKIIAALVADDEDPKPLYTQTFYDRKLERYTRLEDFLRPAFYTITASLEGSTSGICSWTAGTVTKQGSCSEMPLEISRDWSGPQRAVKVMASDGSGRRGSACVYIKEKLIVGMGESFASGEGNPDQPTRWHLIAAVRDAPTRARRSKRLDALWWSRKNGPLRNVPEGADAQWWDNSCHRSLLSQQAIAAMSDAARDRQRVTTFLSFACSGATILDGIVAPRVEAPGVTRLPKSERGSSPAISQSQINQTVSTLCAGPTSKQFLPIPAEAKVWRRLNLPPETPNQPNKHVTVLGCSDWRRFPDALLLSIGGNDVGFGGVIYWGIVPPAGRRPLSWIYDPLIGVNRDADRDPEAKKPDFAVVCPERYADIRCQESDFTAQTLLYELPHLYGLMDRAFATSGLDRAPTKVHMSYPPITRDEDGELCGEIWRPAEGRAYEFQLEPWMPLYAQVLGKYVLGDVPVAAAFRDWSFGLYNDITLDECRQGSLRPSVYQEMCIVERQMVERLNDAVSHHVGWSILSAAHLPVTHGICAAGPELSRAASAEKWNIYRRSFGWPRWRGGAWADGWPRPTEWKPYDPERQRWFRTSTDSALTQSVFDGGLGKSDRLRTDAQRQEESNSGSVHPTALMHAAMAELVAEKLGDSQ